MSGLTNTMDGLAAQGEMNRLLDELFGASGTAGSNHDPAGAGEAGATFVPDRDEGP